MKVYVHPASPNCRKVLATIHHLELDVEQQIVELGKGEQKESEYLSLNPNGMVPLLVDGSTKLWESNAIMGYLASKKDNSLWPKSDLRYDILRWEFWQLAHWGPACDILITENMLKPMFMKAEPDEKRVQEGLEQFARFGSILNAQLKGRDFVTGSELTLADFALAAPLVFRDSGKLPVDDYPEIQRWEARINELPAWRKSAPKLAA